MAPYRDDVSCLGQSDRWLLSNSFIEGSAMQILLAGRGCDTPLV
jgi:hypothetical protein